MKRSDLRKSGLRRNGVPMHWVDHEEEHVTFRGKYPSVLAIPGIMKKYPDYTHSIISWELFMERYNVKD